MAREGPSYSMFGPKDEDDDEFEMGMDDARTRSVGRQGTSHSCAILTGFFFGGYELRL